MTPAEIMYPELSDAAQDLREKDEPFAFATIVRTSGSTAAKPGAKALLASDGTILGGWLGGGCARGAVKRATLKALETGVPQLISVAPEELLEKIGVAPGDEQDGVTYSRNGCPSRGSVDIFIEPCLPLPQLVVFGASPVARALTDLAPRFEWAVSESFETANGSRLRAVVVATQGQGDFDALKAALDAEPSYCAFVGSKKKFRALAEKLTASGAENARIDAVKAPAGLNIHAVSAEEIALSIMAELVSLRRAPRKDAADG